MIRDARGFPSPLLFDIPPDVSGQVKRSYLVDATISIIVAHPDFQERMSYSRLGQPRVTERLGAYIAATLSIHYHYDPLPLQGSVLRQVRLHAGAA